MYFITPLQEKIFVGSIVPERQYMFDMDLETGITVIWNPSSEAHIVVDHQKIELEKNCIIFLTSYHKVDDIDYKKLNILQFNQAFHCVENHDSQIGCKGVLFFGAASVPKIVIPDERLRRFELLWEIFLMEIDESDVLKLDMLRGLLKRFLILCLRIFNQSGQTVAEDRTNTGLIREFNYLVEKHFKEYTKVSDYAKLLFKSPKTLSNIFNKYTDRTPLQVINERRLLEAKRLLSYTDEPIQIIADDLNFSDIQTFSHFFKSKAGVAPSIFREMHVPEK